MDSYSSGGAIERAIYIGDVQQIPPRITTKCYRGCWGVIEGKRDNLTP